MITSKAGEGLSPRSCARSWKRRVPPSRWGSRPPRAVSGYLRRLRLTDRPVLPREDVLGCVVFPSDKAVGLTVAEGRPWAWPADHCRGTGTGMWLVHVLLPCSTGCIGDRTAWRACHPCREYVGVLILVPRLFLGRRRTAGGQTARRPEGVGYAGMAVARLPRRRPGPGHTGLGPEPAGRWHSPSLPGLGGDGVGPRRPTGGGRGRGRRGGRVGGRAGRGRAGLGAAGRAGGALARPRHR